MIPSRQCISRRIGARASICLLALLIAGPPGLIQAASPVPAGVPMPNPKLTPGEAFATVTTAEVCTPGYAKSVRSVSNKVKTQVYRAYGILHHKSGEYEVDHLISLELGGDNGIRNLWTEPYNNP